MDESNMESAPSSGAQGQPSPGVSGSSGGQPSSPVDGSAFEAVLKKLNELDSQVRAFQSGKDKGIAKLSKEFDNLSEQFARYEQYRQKGLTPEQASREIQLDDLLAERRSAVSQAPPAAPANLGGNQAQGPDTDSVVESFLKVAGLDANSADVVQILRGSADPIAQIGKLSALAEQRKAQAAVPPNPAAVLPGGGGQSVPEPDLAVQYAERLKQIPRGPGAPELLRKLREEFREKAKKAGKRMEFDEPR